MASTRTNLTLAFVGALVAVTAALGLTLWTVRNASRLPRRSTLRCNTGRRRATLVLDAASAQKAVIVGPNTPPQSEIVTPRLRALLDAFPGLHGRRRQPGHATLSLECRTAAGSRNRGYSARRRSRVLPNDSAAVLSLPRHRRASARLEADFRYDRGDPRPRNRRRHNVEDHHASPRIQDRSLLHRAAHHRSCRVARVVSDAASRLNASRRSTMTSPRSPTDEVFIGG